MNLIDEVKQAYRDLKKMAEEAGIIKNIEEENEKPSMRVIHDRLVELGQNTGSYRKALNIYFENGIIDEEDVKELRNTQFYDLLYEELKEQDFFTEKNKKETTTWNLEII